MSISIYTKQLLKKLITEVFESNTNVTELSFVPDVWVHWPKDKLLYKITKVQGNGPHSETFGIVYVGTENAAREWQKNRQDLLKYVKNGEALIVTSDVANKLKLTYKKSQTYK